jgi:hypothetical protein
MVVGCEPSLGWHTARSSQFSISQKLPLTSSITPQIKAQCLHHPRARTRRPCSLHTHRPCLRFRSTRNRIARPRLPPTSPSSEKPTECRLRSSAGPRAPRACPGQHPPPRPWIRRITLASDVYPRSSTTLWTTTPSTTATSPLSSFNPRSRSPEPAHPSVQSSNEGILQSHRQRHSPPTDHRSKGPAPHSKATCSPKPMTGSLPGTTPAGTPRDQSRDRNGGGRCPRTGGRSGSIPRCLISPNRSRSSPRGKGA